MKYLDVERLRAIDDAAFRQCDPYPWVNPEGLLTDEAFRQLSADLPTTAQMDQSFGRERMHGQASHDRYVLEWEDGLDVAPSWKEFVAELEGEEYRAFMRRMLGSNGFQLAYHWHYTPPGCSVSPHCDSLKKLGSHIFYFNDPEDWDPAWGGQTVILDDGGRLDRRSAPSFDDFDREICSDALGNRSLLFARRRDSWHGVRPLTCPEGRLRKVFIVVIKRAGAIERVRRFVGLDARGVGRSVRRTPALGAGAGHAT